MIPGVGIGLRADQCGKQDRRAADTLLVGINEVRMEDAMMILQKARWPQCSGLDDGSGSFHPFSGIDMPRKISTLQSLASTVTFGLEKWDGRDDNHTVSYLFHAQNANYSLGYSLCPFWDG